MDHEEDGCMRASRYVEYKEDISNSFLKTVGNRILSSSEVATHTGFGKTKVVKLLKSLVGRGYVKIEGEGRGATYTIT